MMRIAFIPLAFLLAACVNEAEPVADETCAPSRFQDRIGQRWTEEMTTSLTGPVRVIGPGTMVTMDHNPDRLNILVDEDDIVTGFRCG